MSYVRISTFIPAMGKGPEMLAVLRDWVEQQHAKGRPRSLSRRLFSSEGFSFSIATPFETLTDLHNELQSLPSEGFPSAKLATLSDRMGGMSVAQVIVPPRQPSRPLTQAIIRVGYFRPAPGKRHELREALVAAVTADQAAGHETGLSVRPFDPAPFPFARNWRFANFAELEAASQAQQQRSDYQDFTTRFSLLCGGQINFAINEVLIPMHRPA